MTSDPKMTSDPLTLERADPKRLVYESFRIDGITPALPSRDEPNQKVTISGRITNTSDVELSNLQVAFWRSLDPIQTAEGMTTALGRSIFVDWALSLPEGVVAAEAARLLLDAYAPKAQAAGEVGHPMVKVLVDGASASVTTPRRKGGRAGRFAGTE